MEKFQLNRLNYLIKNYVGKNVDQMLPFLNFFNRIGSYERKQYIIHILTQKDYLQQ